MAEARRMRSAKENLWKLNGFFDRHIVIGKNLTAVQFQWIRIRRVDHDVPVQRFLHVFLESDLALEAAVRRGRKNLFQLGIVVTVQHHVEFRDAGLIAARHMPGKRVMEFVQTGLQR